MAASIDLTPLEQLVARAASVQADCKRRVEDEPPAPENLERRFVNRRERAKKLQARMLRFSGIFNAGYGTDEQHPHSEASATPNTRFLSSPSWSRAFAASSNSRFFACSSIFFSSARISRAICFSDIAS